MKTELTIEESAKLIDLGVDKKLASIKEFVPIHPEVLKGNAEYATPKPGTPSHGASTSSPTESSAATTGPHPTYPTHKTYKTYPPKQPQQVV